MGHPRPGAPEGDLDYAPTECKGFAPGWRVPTDTVLRVTVSPSKQEQFSTLKVDKTKYTVRQDDSFTTYYSNRGVGIEYAVSADDRVISVSYIPSTDDVSLRCPGFPLEDGSVMNHPRFDSYGKLEFAEETIRLDSLAIRLTEKPQLRGFIVVFGGRVGCQSEANVRARRARNYLIHKRGIRPIQIVAIDGGYRENFSVELYALPKDVGRPDVVPTVPASEFKLLRATNCLE